MRLHQKIELRAGGFERRIVRRLSQPRRSSRNGPAVVPRHLQLPVAELVERFAPPAVATVQSERSNPLRMPPFGRVISRHRKLMADLDLRLARIRPQFM